MAQFFLIRPVLLIFNFLLYFIIQFYLITDLKAQRFEDVVYISDGSVIRGRIICDSISGTLRILNHAGDIWAFSRDKIDSVKHERYCEFKTLSFNQNGFEVGANAEFLIRSHQNAVGKAVIPGVQISLGYRIRNYGSTGTEIGASFYDWLEVPVSWYARLRFSDRKFTPLLLLRAGYTIPAEKRENDENFQFKSLGGFHGSIGAGLENIINENTAFLFTLSYHLQELNYHLTPHNQWIQERDRREIYSRMRLSVGYVFK